MTATVHISFLIKVLTSNLSALLKSVSMIKSEKETLSYASYRMLEDHYSAAGDGRGGVVLGPPTSLPRKLIL